MPKKIVVEVLFENVPEELDRESLVEYVEEACRYWRRQGDPDGPLNDMPADAINARPRKRYDRPREHQLRVLQ